MGYFLPGTDPDKNYFNSGESLVCGLFLPPLAWMKIFASKEAGLELPS